LMLNASQEDLQLQRQQFEERERRERERMDQERGFYQRRIKDLEESQKRNEGGSSSRRW
jgi:hypothetical protein